MTTKLKDKIVHLNFRAFLRVAKYFSTDLLLSGRLQRQFELNIVQLKRLIQSFPFDPFQKKFFECFTLVIVGT